MRKMVAVITMVLAIGLVNWSIYDKETQLAQGQLMYLKLAPVDPRSLMQGDYMALRFELADEIRKALEQSQDRYYQEGFDGTVVVQLDERHIATFARLKDDKALADNEHLLFYRFRNNRVKFATNAFFFQEGTASAYDMAEYGAFKVNGEGEPLLVSLHDGDLSRLGSEPGETRAQ